MSAINESALRILIPRRNLRGSLRLQTRSLIHRSIALIRVERLRADT